MIFDHFLLKSCFIIRLFNLFLGKITMRREIGIKYKNLTPQKELEKIYERNLTKYKDKYGPTVDYLRNTANKSWEEIIESATRTGGTDLGL